MTTSAKLVATLKKALKVRGLTYRQVADRLDLSESAVKQMFANGNFSLRRLDQLCEVAEIDLAELVDRSQEQHKRIEKLPLEFEKEIVADPKLLLVTYCLINYWRFDEIVERYAITRAEGLGYLRRLDRMKIIEVLPGDRVRLLVANNFAWRRNGPMERYFNRHVQTEFFHYDFAAEDALRVVKNGTLSARAHTQMRDKLVSIGEQFDETAWEERNLPANDRHGATMVLAIRRWTFAPFRDLERGAADEPAS